MAGGIYLSSAALPFGDVCGVLWYAVHQLQLALRPCPPTLGTGPHARVSSPTSSRLRVGGRRAVVGGGAISCRLRGLVFAVFACRSAGVPACGSASHLTSPSDPHTHVTCVPSAHTVMVRVGGWLPAVLTSSKSFRASKASQVRARPPAVGGALPLARLRYEQIPTEKAPMHRMSYPPPQSWTEVMGRRRHASKRRGRRAAARPPPATANGGRGSTHPSTPASSRAVAWSGSMGGTSRGRPPGVGGGHSATAPSRPLPPTPGGTAASSPPPTLRATTTMRAASRSPATS